MPLGGQYTESDQWVGKFNYAFIIKGNQPEKGKARVALIPGTISSNSADCHNYSRIIGGHCSGAVFPASCCRAGQI